MQQNATAVGASSQTPLGKLSAPLPHSWFHTRQRRRGHMCPDLPIFDLHGSINALDTCHNCYTITRGQRTIFVKVFFDCVVGAVVGLYQIKSNHLLAHKIGLQTTWQNDNA